MKEETLLKLLRIQSNLSPKDFKNLFGEEDGQRLFQNYARDGWNLLSFLFNSVNGERRENLLNFINSQID